MLSHKSKNQVDHLEKYDSDLYKIQLSSELLMIMVVLSRTNKKTNHILRFFPLGFIPHTTMTTIMMMLLLIISKTINDLFRICLNLFKDGGEDGDQEVQEHHVADQHVASQEGNGEITEI